MRILHYSLGLPPYRSGGLTNVSITLMEEQSKTNDVFLLWPGNKKIFSQKIAIKKSTKFKNIQTYKLVNPLPVSLMEGVKNPEKFMSKCYGISNFEKFIDEIKPDVVHIHTFMGLYKEMLFFLNKKNIRIVFTTHDYFGICPNVTLYNHITHKICEGEKCCEMCNVNAISIKKIWFKQSNIFRFIKSHFKFSFIKQNNILQTKNSINDNIYNKCDYINLLEYYKEMFHKIDFFHFNSNLSKKVFEKYLGKINGKVINLTIPNNYDNKIINNKNDIINLGYIGSNLEEKGIYMLIEILDSINKNKIKYYLHIFNDKILINRQFIIKHKKYTYSNIKENFAFLDAVVVPSMWNETFGMGVVEALSCNIPVILSENVGAKDIVNFNNSWVYSTKNELEKLLNALKKNNFVQKKMFLIDNPYKNNYNDFINMIYFCYGGKHN